MSSSCVMPKELEIDAGKDERFCFSGWFHRPKLARYNAPGTLYNFHEHVSSLKENISIVFKDKGSARTTCLGLLDYLEANFHDLGQLTVTLAHHHIVVVDLLKKERELWLRWQGLCQHVIDRTFEEYVTTETAKTPESWNRLYLANLFGVDIHKIHRLDFNNRPRLFWLRFPGGSTKLDTDFLRLLRDLRDCRHQFRPKERPGDKKCIEGTWLWGVLSKSVSDSDTVSLCETIDRDNLQCYDRTHVIKVPKPDKKEDLVRIWLDNGEKPKQYA